MTDFPTNSITINEMWNMINRKENSTFGIAGYEPAKVYFDHIKNKNDRETWKMHSKVWSQKDHYPKLKLPLDKEGKEIMPQRPSFIEDYIKTKKANFSQEKFDKFVGRLKEKGSSLEELEGIKPKKKEEGTKVNKKDFKERTTIISEVINQENKKYNYPEHITQIIEKVKERQAKYTKRTIPVKSNLSKEDRVSFLSDAQYIGENRPFYYKKIDEEKKEKEFFPDKNNVLTRSPKWKMHKALEIDKKPQEIREELYNEKVNKLKESWESRRVKFIDDVSLSYFNLHHGHKGGFKYYKESEKPEQYVQAKTNNPDRSPGPQSYFKSPRLNERSPKSKEGQDEGDSGSPKVFYANRDKIDKMIYKPLKSYVF